jgi:uncharacterized protein
MAPRNRLTEGLVDNALRGDLAWVKALLAQGADANATDGTPFEAPVLACAALQGQTAVVQELLARGADVNATDIDGETSLMYAVAGLINEQLAEGLLPSHMHAMAGRHPATIAVLLADPNLRIEGRNGARDLFSAALLGRLDVVDRLLEEGADPNARDVGGLTALMGAAGLGYTAVVQGLLRRDALVDARDQAGETALMWAARWGDMALLGVLRAAGADVNARENMGRTALMAAAGAGHVAAVRLLLEHGADVSPRDKWTSSQTALSMALRAAQLPLKQKADVITQDEQCVKSAPGIAARADHPAVIELLRAAGATE